VHTDAYYVERALELKALQADYIAIKDPTGLLTPERGRTLFPAIVAAAGDIPVQLHSHCQSGLAPEVYSEAIRAGFRHGYTAARPLANGASLPATEDIAVRAAAEGCATGIDAQALAELSGYFTWVAEREGKPIGQPARYDPALYEHQVPGGMISNLRSQLAAMRMEDRLPAILDEVAQVRRDLGYPILVSPFAQYIVTQAVLNVVQGERYRTIPDEVRKYACGVYGRLAAEPSAAFLERANIRPHEIVTERAGAHVEPWLPRLRAELGAGASDESILLAAFYDKALLAPLAQPARHYDFRTSPLVELIRHVGSRRELAHARIRFAGTDFSVSLR
jgi:pyruvate/oxaloacetate carboxyltransferase